MFFASIRPQRGSQLQIPAGGGVDAHIFAWGNHPDVTDVGQSILLGVFQIGQQRPSGGNATSDPIAAQFLKVSLLEMPQHTASCQAFVKGVAA